MRGFGDVGDVGGELGGDAGGDVGGYGWVRQAAVEDVEGVVQGEEGDGVVDCCWVDWVAGGTGG